MKDFKKVILNTFLFAGIIAVFVIGYFLLGEDFGEMFKYWAVILALTIAVIPITGLLFGRFTDKGYIFGKVIGPLLAGTLAWILSSLHIVKFSEGLCVGAAVIVAVLSYILGFFLGKRGKKVSDNRYTSLNIILRYELFFAVLFVAYMYMKGFNPQCYGTEKMMDYGFMTRMMRTDFFPANDLWFTGDKMNYYYFGQYIATFLTKLSFSTVAYGYNLALGFGFAVCITCSYSIGRNLLIVKFGKKGLSVLGGALSAMFVTFAGNFHYVLMYKLVPMVKELLGMEVTEYWFPNSTRYIGYMPDVADKTIHEFPSYSYILGDLHAHVCDIVNVLLFIALLIALVYEVKSKRDNSIYPGGKISLKRMPDIRIFALGILLGIIKMTNYWDFPIYFVVAGAVILITSGIMTNFTAKAFAITGIAAAYILALAELISLPFTISFINMSSGIGIVDRHTQFYQFMILWGLPILTFTGYFVSLISRNKAYAGGGDAPSERKGLWGFLARMETTDLFVFIIGACAVGLMLVPEVFYVKDIYGYDFERANTMFKMTYQAFILFGLMMGYVFTCFVFKPGTGKQRSFGIAGLVIALLTCGYFFTSSYRWFFGDSFCADNYTTIRGDRYISNEAPSDAAIVLWLNENAEDDEIIVESNGNSYTISNRVSVLTGLPTVLGWRTHEWLWHNDVSVVDDRANEVRDIYTSNSEWIARSILDKYEVDYIIIGSCEYEAFSQSGMDVEFLKSLGEVVFKGYPDINNQVSYIIKVKR